MKCNYLRNVSCVESSYLGNKKLKSHLVNGLKGNYELLLRQ